MNGQGQSVGRTWSSGSADRRAILYDGTAHDLGTFGGSNSTASGINSDGQVTGAAYLDGDTAYHAFLYDGALHDLGTLGGTSSGGYAINDNGWITGDSYTLGDAAYHAFVYDGMMHDLGTLSGAADGASEGRGINSAGVVTGRSSTSTIGVEHGFLYDGKMHDLGSLGEYFCEGVSINSTGEVVGHSHISPTLGTFHAFRYTHESGMVDLNTLINPLLGWLLTDAEAINDAGQIAGSGIFGGEHHGFLLTPVPEPSTFALLAIAAPLVAGWRTSRRR
jgi:probable HAF family extracellular repeat protein